MRGSGSGSSGALKPVAVFGCYLLSRLKITKLDSTRTPCLQTVCHTIRKQPRSSRRWWLKPGCVPTWRWHEMLCVNFWLSIWWLLKGQFTQITIPYHPFNNIVCRYTKGKKSIYLNIVTFHLVIFIHIDTSSTFYVKKKYCKYKANCFGKQNKLTFLSTGWLYLLVCWGQHSKGL